MWLEVGRTSASVRSENWEIERGSPDGVCAGRAGGVGCAWRSRLRDVLPGDSRSGSGLFFGCVRCGWHGSSLGTGLDRESERARSARDHPVRGGVEPEGGEGCAPVSHRGGRPPVGSGRPLWVGPREQYTGFGGSSQVGKREGERAREGVLWVAIGVAGRDGLVALSRCFALWLFRYLGVPLNQMA